MEPSRGPAHGRGKESRQAPSFSAVVKKMGTGSRPPGIAAKHSVPRGACPHFVTASERSEEPPQNASLPENLAAGQPRREPRGSGGGKVGLAKVEIAQPSEACEAINGGVGDERLAQLQPGEVLHVGQRGQGFVVDARLVQTQPGERPQRRRWTRPAPLMGTPRTESCRRAVSDASCRNPSSVTLKHLARLSSSSDRRANFARPASVIDASSIVRLLKERELADDRQTLVVDPISAEAKDFEASLAPRAVAAPDCPLRRSRGDRVRGAEKWRQAARAPDR